MGTTKIPFTDLRSSNLDAPRPSHLSMWLPVYLFVLGIACVVLGAMLIGTIATHDIEGTTGFKVGGAIGLFFFGLALVLYSCESSKI